MFPQRLRLFDNNKIRSMNSVELINVRTINLYNYIPIHNIYIAHHSLLSHLFYNTTFSQELFCHIELMHIIWTAPVSARVALQICHIVYSICQVVLR